MIYEEYLLYFLFLLLKVGVNFKYLCIGLIFRQISSLYICSRTSVLSILV
jgi:hypothetical protein